MKLWQKFLALGALLCLPTAVAETKIDQKCYHSGNSPYYHWDAACDFGTFSLNNEDYDWEKAVLGNDAIQNYRPCPGCASAFVPTFSGSFPEWPHEEKPWDFGNANTRLSPAQRESWGNVADAIDERFGEGPYPEDYAGIYYNACGGYTIMMVNPTPERIEAYRSALKGEFWVVEATYSLNTLRALQTCMEAIMGFEGLNICETSVSIDGNCLVVGADRVDASAQSAITAYMAMKGYEDPKMLVLEPAEPSVTSAF